MKGFPQKDLSVKIIEDNILAIEGNTEIKTDSSFSRKSFKHQFNISNSNMEQVSSALSSDGVLTIVAPKKVYNNYRLK